MLAVDTATRTSRLALPRRTPAFTLDEAARIRRDLLASANDIHCPRCASPLAIVHAGNEGSATWMTGCSTCRLSLVVQRQAGDIA